MIEHAETRPDRFSVHVRRVCRIGEDLVAPRLRRTVRSGDVRFLACPLVHSTLADIFGEPWQCPLRHAPMDGRNTERTPEHHAYDPL